MIWSSFSSLALIDLTIVGLSTILLAIVVYQGMLKRKEPALVGRVLMASGIAITALYYLLDFFALAALPRLVGPESALAVIEFMQQHIRPSATVVSVALIVSGVIFAVHKRSGSEQLRRQHGGEIRRALESVIKSENRFSSLIEHYSDSVYCFEFIPPVPTSVPINEQIKRSYDAVLVECNKTFAMAHNAESPLQIIGKRYDELITSEDSASHDRLYRVWALSNYQLSDYEFCYQTRGGDDAAMNLNVTGVVEDGQLLRVWGIEKNILDVKEANAALAGRQDYQNLLAGISTRLLTGRHAEISETMESCLRNLCQYAKADRASLVWFDKETGSVEVIGFWNATRQHPGSQFPMNGFPWIASCLIEGKTVSYDSVDDLPDEAIIDKKSLLELGNISGVVSPLVVDGESLGACSIVQTERVRTWSDQEVSDLRVIAELLGNVLLRVKTRDQLDCALDELGVAKSRLEAENVYLQQEISSTHGFHELIGNSDNLKQCLHQVSQVAATNTPVLIQGETGTGKELIARAIHERSDRSSRPLVKINCAALPINLIESELFGHERGAFTDATARKRGLFDLADKGTLFLDEIGDLPVDLQSKLLRVLQEGEFQRLGGSETLVVDVRIIAATNRRLQDAVHCGEFRADLYYRINTFPIELPPLRERHGDIALLARHFVHVHSQQLGKSITAISPTMIRQFEDYSWPGNVRELESVVQRALILATNSTLQLAEPLDGVVLPPGSMAGDTAARPIDLRSAEKEHIVSVLRQAGWKVAGNSGAAAQLGIPPSTLRSKMKKLGIQRDDIAAA